MLSVLEVDLATIVASLPIFWPHLRRNIASILVTHEVEVKITRHSTFVREGNAAHGWDLESGETDPWKLPKLNLREDDMMMNDFRPQGTNPGSSKETAVGSIVEHGTRSWSFGSRALKSPASTYNNSKDFWSKSGRSH